MGIEQQRQFVPQEFALEPIGKEVEVGDLKVGDFSVGHGQRIKLIIDSSTQVGLVFENDTKVYLDRDEKLDVVRA